MKVYRVCNKVFAIYFLRKEIAEKFCYENGTPSNGLRMEEVDVVE